MPGAIPTTAEKAPRAKRSGFTDRTMSPSRMARSALSDTNTSGGFQMFTSRRIPLLIAGLAVAIGLSGCDKMKGMMGLGGGTTDFRNAEVDVSGTPCSDNAKFSTLVLKDGKYELG